MLKIYESESAVIIAAKSHAGKLGIRVIRLSFRQGVTTGWPDHMFLIPGGKPLLIEFKATGKEPSPLQQYKIDLLTALDYNVSVCDSKDKARKAIDEAVRSNTSR